MMKGIRLKALQYAFPRTIPIMVGYLFLGTAYGILMSVNGFSIIWPVLTSVFVFAGSLQYVGITLLVSSVSPVTAFFMALMVNARHLFYGISMLGKYKDMKTMKPYLIFGLTDETFSVLCGEPQPEGICGEWRCFWITFLNQVYWVTGTLIGALAGNVITFDTTGLDFALTALFVVIFVDQWKSEKDHKPAVTGVVCSVLCLLIFGKTAFIIPAMIAILTAVTFGYRKTEGERKHNE